MFETLADHARVNSWFVTDRNREFQIQPKRFSPPNGNLNVFSYFHQSYKLPEARSYYHLFYMNMMSVVALSHFAKVPNFQKQTWFSLAELLNETNTDTLLISEKGLVVPREHVYFMFLDSNQVVLAVKEIPFLKLNWQEEQFVLRVLFNYHYGQAGVSNQIQLKTFVPKDKEEIIRIESDIRVMKQYSHLKTFINGVMSNDFALGNIKPKDYVEVITDTTIIDEEHWKVDDLHMFQSRLDGVGKYLLPFQGQENEELCLCEDADFYIVYRPQGHYAKGLRIVRKEINDVRMVNHRDYTIKQSLVDETLDDLIELMGDGNFNHNDFYVIAHERLSFLKKKAPLVNPLLKRLSELTLEDRLKALKGEIYSVPEWNCAELEASEYVSVMRSDPLSYCPKKVAKAYGYFRATEILAETPRRTFGKRSVALPRGLSGPITVAELSEQGTLLGFSTGKGPSFHTNTPDVTLVEVLPGRMSFFTETKLSQGTVELPSYQSEYRVYLGDSPKTLPGKWKDVTDDPRLKIENGLVSLEGEPEAWLLVLTDNRILVRQKTLRSTRGLLTFSLDEFPGGDIEQQPEMLKVPMAQLDVWLNGHKLIQGLDYFVLFPQVFITNRVFLNNEVAGENQEVHYRCAGLPDHNLQPIQDEIPGGFGWIYNGMLSGNIKGYIGDQGVFQYNVGGCLFHPDEIVGNLDAFNGFPYEFRDLLIPVKTEKNFGTLELREKSRQLAKVFMTRSGSYSIEPPAPKQNYELISPFFSQVVFMACNGLITIPKDRSLRDEEVESLCAPYLYLLKVDPLRNSDRVHRKMVKILPSNMETTYRADPAVFTFLGTVERLYGDNRIDVSSVLELF